MQYRRFGRLDWKVSALGFGMMRLPILDSDSSKINEPEALHMARFAIDQGLNYIDTAYPYHGGNSEAFTGKVLQDGYRQKVRLATKMPVWRIESPADFDTYLNEQLQRLQSETIDFYLLHGMNKEIWPKLYQFGVLDWLEKARASGRIQRVGFSFHDTVAFFKEMIDANPHWDFCQIQYNYMDIERQAGTEGLRYAAAKGLGVVIMEPLLGGRLVDPPDPVKEIWQRAPHQRGPADWALQWLWDQPEVSVILSGMSSMQQVQENIASANRSGVNTLTQEEQEIIALVRSRYQELCPIPCTRCEYCLPCPSELNIPQILSLFNSGKMYDKLELSRDNYRRFVPEGQRAEDCIACQACEAKCPQHIPISEWMVHVHEVLMMGKSYEECL